MHLYSFRSLISTAQTEKQSEAETMADEAHQYFTETQLPPYQKHYDSFKFPSVLSPQPSASSFSLPLFTEAIRTQKPFLDSLLHKSGAILFQNFPVSTAKDFNDVVEAFGFEEFSHVGGPAIRTNVVGRVFTANESPPDQKIPFHPEMAQASEFPSKLLFYCDVEPGKDGETPLVLSHICYERIKEKYPEFVDHMEHHGLIYARILGENDDPSHPAGRGWKSTFSTTDKNIAEQRAAKLGRKLEWIEGGAKVMTGRIPGIRYDKLRQRKVWFNSLIVADKKVATFGDGKPLAADIVDDCFKILEEESVAIPWKKGDVLLIDNWAVLHARNSSDHNSPRRILASLCK